METNVLVQGKRLTTSFSAEPTLVEATRFLEAECHDSLKVRGLVDEEFEELDQIERDLSMHPVIASGSQNSLTMKNAFPSQELLVDSPPPSPPQGDSNLHSNQGESLSDKNLAVSRGVDRKSSSSKATPTKIVLQVSCPSTLPAIGLKIIAFDSDMPVRTVVAKCCQKFGLRDEWRYALCATDGWIAEEDGAPIGIRVGDNRNVTLAQKNQDYLEFISKTRMNSLQSLISSSMGDVVEESLLSSSAMKTGRRRLNDDQLLGSIPPAHSVAIALLAFKSDDEALLSKDGVPPLAIIASKASDVTHEDFAWAMRASLQQSLLIDFQTIQRELRQWDYVAKFSVKEQQRESARFRMGFLNSLQKFYCSGLLYQDSQALVTDVSGRDVSYRLLPTVLHLPNEVTVLVLLTRPTNEFSPVPSAFKWRRSANLCPQIQSALEVAFRPPGQFTHSELTNTMGSASPKVKSKGVRRFYKSSKKSNTGTDDSDSGTSSITKKDEIATMSSKATAAAILSRVRATPPGTTQDKRPAMAVGNLDWAVSLWLGMASQCAPGLHVLLLCTGVDKTYMPCIMVPFMRPGSLPSVWLQKEPEISSDQELALITQGEKGDFGFWIRISEVIKDGLIPFIGNRRPGHVEVLSLPGTNRVLHPLSCSVPGHRSNAIVGLCSFDAICDSIPQPGIISIPIAVFETISHFDPTWAAVHRSTMMALERIKALHTTKISTSKLKCKKSIQTLGGDSVKSYTIQSLAASAPLRSASFASEEDEDNDDDLDPFSPRNRISTASSSSTMSFNDRIEKQTKLVKEIWQARSWTLQGAMAIQKAAFKQQAGSNSLQK